MDKEISKKELEEIIASKFRELGMPESEITYWLEHPVELADCLFEAVELKRIGK